MITHETYECEVCGDTFETEEECVAHELRHDFIDIFTSGARFFNNDGVEIELTDDLTDEQFCDNTWAIIVPGRAVAETIDRIFYKCGYCRPFKEAGINARRIVYDDRRNSWFDADFIIDSINKRLGE